MGLQALGPTGLLLMRASQRTLLQSLSLQLIKGGWCKVGIHRQVLAAGRWLGVDPKAIFFFKSSSQACSAWSLYMHAHVSSQVVSDLAIGAVMVSLQSC